MQRNLFSYIWRYSRREGIPLIDLYFSKNGKRYRSLEQNNPAEPCHTTTRLPSLTGVGEQ